MKTIPIFGHGCPPSRFKMVYFLYDESHVLETRAVEDLVKTTFPDVRFLPLWVNSAINGESKWTTWGTSVRPILVENALMVGIGVAGTCAAHIQERFPELNLSVIAINSPTNCGSISLKKVDNRVAIYSGGYIGGDGEAWPALSEASFNVSWLRYGILSEGGGNLCKYLVSLVIAAYIKKPDIKTVIPEMLLS